MWRDGEIRAGQQVVSNAPPSASHLAALDRESQVLDEKARRADPNIPDAEAKPFPNETPQQAQSNAAQAKRWTEADNTRKAAQGFPKPDQPVRYQKPPLLWRDDGDIRSGLNTNPNVPPSAEHLAALDRESQRITEKARRADPDVPLNQIKPFPGETPHRAQEAAVVAKSQTKARRDEAEKEAERQRGERNGVDDFIDSPAVQVASSLPPVRAGGWVARGATTAWRAVRGAGRSKAPPEAPTPPPQDLPRVAPSPAAAAPASPSETGGVGSPARGVGAKQDKLAGREEPARPQVSLPKPLDKTRGIQPPPTRAAPPTRTDTSNGPMDAPAAPRGLARSVDDGAQLQRSASVTHDGLLPGVAGKPDVGHAAERHQFPGTLTEGKSQFFDAVNIGQLAARTRGITPVRQSNGNYRWVLRDTAPVGVDRQTGLPTTVYTVIRSPDGSTVTVFPGTSLIS